MRKSVDNLLLRACLGFAVMSALGLSGCGEDGEYQPYNRSLSGDDHQLNNAVILDVPFVSQQTEEDCGAACVSMLLQHHGIAHDSADLFDKIAAGSVAGAHIHRIREYLQTLGVEPVVFYPRNDSTLRELVRGGSPVLIPQELNWDGYRSVHAVVVVGIANSGDEYLLHDPIYGAMMTLDTATLNERWIKGGSWGARVGLVVGRERGLLPAAIELEYAHVAEAFERGRYLGETGKLEMASDAFEEVIRTDAGFLPAYLYLGALQSAQARWEEAESNFSIALALDESYYWGLARAKLAAAQAMLGKFEVARTNFAIFLEGSPQALPTEVDDVRRCLAALQGGLESDPDEADAWLLTFLTSGTCFGILSTLLARGRHRRTGRHFAWAAIIAIICCYGSAYYGAVRGSVWYPAIYYLPILPLLLVGGWLWRSRSRGAQERSGSRKIKGV